MSHASRKTKGFTLTEVIVVTAIIAILAAVAIPLVVKLRTNLKMSEANTIAKEIFISAQNRLSAMSASGDMVDFADELKGTDYSGRKIDPADFADSSGWGDIYYITSEDGATTQYLILDDSVISKTLKGGYIVELDPENGNIYSVFYREGTLDKLLSLYTSRDSDSVFTDRSEGNRRDSLTGYYSSADASTSAEITNFDPKVEAVNKEELYLQLTCDNMRTLRASWQYLTISVELTDEHNHTWEKEYKSTDFTGNDWEFYYDKLTARIRLDSMSAGMSFSEITKSGDTSLTAGDTITAKASLRYAKGSRTITTQKPAEATFNSLFASRAGGKVEIAYLRQLNNLRSSILGDNAANITAIVQTQPIDFKPHSWTIDAVCPSSLVPEKAGDKVVYRVVNPLDSFEPISNETLFGGTSRGSASFAGNKLLNFVINYPDTVAAGTVDSGTGLFAQANCDISSVELVDPSVIGTSYTGALVGYLTGGSIDKCGVYLSDQTTDGIWLTQEEMDASLAEHMVSSNSRWFVGGLVGQANSAVISDSFAAINVKGKSNVGGLAGRTNSTTVKNCYASGDVAADGYGGGLIGDILGSSVIKGCYTTSNVSIDGNNWGGGFTAFLGGRASVQTSSAYGLTISTIADDKTTAPFVPVDGGHAAGVLSDCVYLYQKGYNDQYRFTVDGVTSQKYTELRKEAAEKELQLSAEKTHPYNVDLFTVAFPFARTENQTDYYGNWPKEYLLETSLVYYEKYSDGTVGYYADGTSTDTETDAAERVWNLNTLKTQTELDENTLTVSEDGYAILSVYNLIKMEYRLNGNSEETISIQDQAGPDAFIRLKTEKNLTFTDSTDSKFTVDYIYIYQLPLALQETARDITASFYDTLILSCYAKGKEEPVAANYTFYYCPHFAKNAINPGIRENTASRPDDPSDIYVRSARQLNALGRFYYYWNTQNNGMGAKFNFGQEIDINFSAYTKEYCGETFDLTDTNADNIYRNRPIGASGVDKEGNVNPCQFTNTYNGQDHRIIDFCLSEGDRRFTGLFGEILNANLSNIHMVSNGETGYVTSTYNKVIYNKDGSTYYETRAVGALIGLIYVDAKNGVATCGEVTNCTASGYRVGYEAETVNASTAAGGLVGINMGRLSGCSSVNTVSLDVTNQSNLSMSVGGMVGSNNCGRLSQYNVVGLSNCYAGGTLSLNVQNLRNTTRNSIGGVAGGYFAVYTGWDNNGYLPVENKLEIQNCYSFCSFKASNAYTTYGVSGNRNGSYYTLTNCYYLKDTVQSGVTGWTGAVAKTSEQLKTANLGTAFTTAVYTYPTTATLQGEEYPFPTSVKNDGQPAHFGDWPAVVYPGAFLTYYEQYSDNSVGFYFLDGDNVLQNTLDTDNTKTIATAGYGIMQMTDAKLGTYRMLDADEKEITAAISEQTVGTADVQGRTYALHPFTQTGVAALSAGESNAEKQLTLVSGKLNNRQTLYVNVWYGAAITNEEDALSTKEVPFQLRTMQQLVAVKNYKSTTDTSVYFQQTHDIDAAGYTLPTDQKAVVPLVGKTYTISGGDGSYTIKNLSAPLIGDNYGTLAYLKLSDSQFTTAEAQAAALAVTNRAKGTISSCTVTGTKITLNAADTVKTRFGTLCGQNDGKIEGCTVENAVVTDLTAAAGSTIAGFVGQNSAGASVSSSAVIGGSFGLNDVTDAQRPITDKLGKSSVSGFVSVNSGTIGGDMNTLCYVSAGKYQESLLGKSYGDVFLGGDSAYGFVGTNASTGIIKGCFTVASVTGLNEAAGFGGSVGGQVTYSYANCAVSGQIASGFANRVQETTTMDWWGYPVDTLQYCYSIGTVSGSTEGYGFAKTLTGMVDNVYTISDLSGTTGTKTGFTDGATEKYDYDNRTSNQGYYNDQYYWVSDANKTINTGVKDSSGAGQCTLSGLKWQAKNWIQTKTAYPFTESNGTKYFASLQDGPDHYGDWPLAQLGKIGISWNKCELYWNGYWYDYRLTGGGAAGYDVDTEDQDMTPPIVTWDPSYSTRGTRYYLYVSDDLFPDYPDGWTITSNKGSVGTEENVSPDGYRYFRLNDVSNNATFQFMLDGKLKFTITIKTNGNTVSLTYNEA
ncbi:MAG: prepilin-type N-terminal cleavage/methylation domain-containing protein [Clostridiales bacterium]|nr:prepilin-type N-terminal cleavage/methylation domain-containing protein [Clostridiales bacterium]